MGVCREDLVFNIARHVDSTVHLFEKWGLPIWKDEKGEYVHEGRWQFMINGESYKVVVAEAAKNAMKTAEATRRDLRARLRRRALDVGGRCVGAMGFSTREKKFYVFKAKAVMAAMGGAVHVFRPRSTGRGSGPVLVSAVQLRLIRLLHHPGRRRDDLPGGPLHSGPLQGRLRAGGRLVPLV
jgi:adenylylsulfate reductase subunit A